MKKTVIVCDSCGDEIDDLRLLQPLHAGPLAHQDPSYPYPFFFLKIAALQVEDYRLYRDCGMEPSAADLCWKCRQMALKKVSDF